MAAAQFPSSRHLPWEGCYNVRDLGGLPLPGGGETRWRAIVRADLLARLTPAGRQALLAYGVRTIVDLRSPQEAAHQPSIISSPEPGMPAYHNLPLESFAPRVSALIGRAASRAEVYAIILDQYPHLVAAALRTIAAAPPGGVVIHCHAGKDRTGMISALLLSLAGVPAEHIAADYAESQVRLQPLYAQEARPDAGDAARSFWERPTATADMMAQMLDHLADAYGGTTAYLRRAGLTSSEIARLTRRLVEKAPAA